MVPPNNRATSNYEHTILDNFELEMGASTITDFHWFGAYYEDVPSKDEFTLDIFDENFNLVNEIDGSATTRAGTGITVDFPILGGWPRALSFCVLVESCAAFVLL